LYILNEINQLCKDNDLPGPEELFFSIFSCKNETLATNFFSGITGLNNFSVDFLRNFEHYLKESIKSPENCYLGN
jgi:hypothetical protein